MSDQGSFPDQVYINHLRDALWQRPTSFAAIMVGAGFSLNAQPVRVDLAGMPAWSELAEKLVEDLYPASDASAAWYRAEALRATSGTSGLLRIAEEYATAFGRDRLDQRLKQAVPDLSFEPSELHRQLLELPWRDVLTTNWDTLLERTVRHVPERDYRVIADVADLSGSSAPRIVKLHGSFEHVRPFIVSEEDYRTYPTLFAPFVNLVRQTAMECVLCLVGFSGSDPNFLAWTGWVRDQLGPHQPNIFLVSLNRYSAAQRQILESRKIKIIDLGQLKGLENHPRRHAEALRWFFDNLKAGRPLLPSIDWPGAASTGHVAAAPGLPPIPPGPRPDYPGYARPPSTHEFTLAWAVATASIWKRARASYPGWLIAPRQVRSRVAENLFFAPSRTVATLKTGSLHTRLLVYRELVWQLDVCQMPAPQTVFEAIAQAIEEVETVSKGLDANMAVTARRAQEVVKPDASGADVETSQAIGKLGVQSPIGTAWLELVLVLIRHARLLGDGAAFARWSALAESSRDYARDLWARLSYEKCLFALGNVDRQALAQAYNAWGEDDGGDPFHAIRRASIAVELGVLAEARRICERGLDNIRQSRDRGREDVASLSRESWALYLLRAVRLASTGGVGGPSAEALRTESAFAAECHDRWRSLAPLVGGPREELLGTLSELMEATAPSRRPSSVSGQLIDDVSWSTLAAPLQTLMLVDAAGLPAYVGMGSLTMKHRLVAVRRLRQASPTLSTVALMRIGRFDERFEETDLFEPVWVARLGESEAHQLAARAAQLLDLAFLSERTDRNFQRRAPGFWLERVNFAATLLSKLVGRTPIATCKETLKTVLRYFREGHAGDFRVLKSLNALFDRSVAALPFEDRAEFVAELAAMPFGPGKLGFDWPSWLGELQGKPLPTVRSRLKPAFDDTVQMLLEAARDEAAAKSAESRVRLAILYDLQVLTDAECRSFAEALWASIAALPANRDLSDGDLLALPEPSPGHAVAAFRQGYLSGETADPFVVDAGFNNSATLRTLADRLRALIIAGVPRRPNQRSIDIQPDEAKLLSQRLLALIEATVSQMGIYSMVSESALLHNEQRALGEVAIPLLPWDDAGHTSYVLGRLDDLDREGFDVRDALLACAAREPSRLAPIIESLDAELRSHRVETVERALEVVTLWTLRQKAWGLPSVPARLVSDVAYLVQDTWLAVAVGALYAVLELARNQASCLDGADLDHIVSGLASLRTQASYDAADFSPNAGDSAQRVLDLRVAAVRLCHELARLRPNDEIIRQWIADGEFDPLPEVRRVGWLKGEAEGPGGEAAHDSDGGS